MRKFKKEIIVDAIQWTGDNYDDILIFVDNQYVEYNHESKILKISTLYGNVSLHVNQWIVNDGSHNYVYSDETFKLRYKEIIETKIDFNKVEIED